MTADDIVSSARACLKTKFRHQGRIPGLALDCAGLIVQVAKDNDIEYIDVPAYGRNPSGGLLEGTLDSQPSLYQVDKASRQVGDVLLMRFEGEPQHLGICAGETMIHSYLQVGMVCEHSITEDWVAKIVRVYRFKGL